MTRENTVNVPTQSLCDWDAFEDDISDVINDSIDMDWNSLHGARAVLDWLNGKAPYAAPLHEGEGEPVAWLYTENKWKDGPRHRLSIKRQGVSDEDANEFEITETPLYAAPPPSVEVFGSSAEGADTHRTTADGCSSNEGAGE